MNQREMLRNLIKATNGLFFSVTWVKSEVVHASPLTHIATPIVKYNELGYVRENCKEPESWQEGVTHMRRDGTLCSGRFAGWIQFRHTIQNNTCWSFDFEERMKTFI